MDRFNRHDAPDRTVDPLWQMSHQMAQDARNELMRNLMNALDAYKPASRQSLAIAYLGTNWVLHPQYRYDPRHSNNLKTWASSRGHQDYIARVIALAKTARDANPFFQPTQE